MAAVQPNESHAVRTIGRHRHEAVLAQRAVVVRRDRRRPGGALVLRMRHADAVVVGAPTFLLQPERPPAAVVGDRDLRMVSPVDEPVAAARDFVRFAEFAADRQRRHLQARAAFGQALLPTQQKALVRGIGHHMWGQRVGFDRQLDRHQLGGPGEGKARAEQTQKLRCQVSSYHRGSPNMNWPAP